MSKIIDMNNISINTLDLKTGDILLFDDRSKTCLGCWNQVIKCFTKTVDDGLNKYISPDSDWSLSLPQL